jgi:hypothetical protein
MQILGKINKFGVVYWIVILKRTWKEYNVRCMLNFVGSGKTSEADYFVIIKAGVVFTDKHYPGRNKSYKLLKDELIY